MNRKVDVITDLNGNKIVFINDIIFKGKRKINWKDVENYLKQYVGEFYEIAEDGEIVYIGSDLPDEYSHSNYTHLLKGANAKAKANAVQNLPQIIEIAAGRQHRENKKSKHSVDAEYGWYRYESRFALPVYDTEGDLDHYNVFHAALIFRHAKDDRLYLYDIMAIKKETSNLFQS